MTEPRIDLTVNGVYHGDFPSVYDAMEEANRLSCCDREDGYVREPTTASLQSGYIKAIADLQPDGKWRIVQPPFTTHPHQTAQDWIATASLLASLQAHADNWARRDRLAKGEPVLTEDR